MSCGTLAWEKSPVQSRLRNHHVTLVASTKAGAFLYAIGGANLDVTLNNVDRAPIGADGALGAWSAGPALPVPVGGLAGGLVGNVVVVAGGMTMQGTTDKSWSAVVGDDGSLGSWKQGGSVAHPRMHPGAFVKDSALYVVGGFDAASVWDDVVRSDVSPDGSLSDWRPAGKLPSPRSHFGLTYVDGAVYLSGGLDQSANGSPPPLADVSLGRIGEDGSLGDWTPMPKLPVALCTHASFVYGGYLYVVGGLSGAAYKHERRAWRAPIQSDHSLGAWQSVAPLPTARAHVHQLPIFADRVYSVGGALDGQLNSTDEIAIGAFR